MVFPGLVLLLLTMVTLVMITVFRVAFTVVIRMATVAPMISVKNLGIVKLVTLTTQHEKGSKAHSEKQMTEKSHGFVFNREPEILQLPSYSIR